MQDHPTNNQTSTTQPVTHISAGELTFPLTIRNRKVAVFEGNVKAMSSLNDKGKFDILPHHGNLITLIKEYITIYKTDGTKQTLPIENGIVYVRKSEAHCYIDLLSGTENAIATNPSKTSATTA